MRPLKRLSPWCYIEHGKLYRKDFLITFETKESIYQIPLDSFAMLLVGPGVNISSNCLSHIGKYNGTLAISSSSAIPKMIYSSLHSSGNARLSEKQALLFSSKNKRLDTSKVFCNFRFENEKERINKARSLSELMGIEGSLVKKIYQQVFGKTFKRKYDCDDSINKILNIANNALYSYSFVVCTRLGLNPHLGFYHSSRRNGLLFDLGDMLKTKEYYSILKEGAYNSKVSEVLKKISNLIYENYNKKLVSEVLNVFGENSNKEPILDTFGEWTVFDT